MCAYRADFRRFLAYADMSAIGTLPNHIAVLGEYHISFHVCKKLSVSILMLFFNLGNASNNLAISVSFFFGFLGEISVHIGPFVILTFRCCQQAFCGGTDTVIQ